MKYFGQQRVSNNRESGIKTKILTRFVLSLRRIIESRNEKIIIKNNGGDQARRFFFFLLVISRLYECIHSRDRARIISSQVNITGGWYSPRESHHRLPRRPVPPPYHPPVPPPTAHGNGAKSMEHRDREEINGKRGGRKRICPGRKENEEGVDGFIWSGELANCSTIEERISRRIREVGRIANSAVASLSRSLANIPSIFLRSSFLCDLQSLRLAHTYTNTKVYT